MICRRFYKTIMVRMLSNKRLTNFRMYGSKGLCYRNVAGVKDTQFQGLSKTVRYERPTKPQGFRHLKQDQRKNLKLYVKINSQERGK